MRNENNEASLESLSNSPDTILEQLKILSAEKRNCENKIDELKQTLANILCPFKVGDNITICGYSHGGKRGRVEKIRGGYSEQTRKYDFITHETITLTDDKIEGEFYWVVSGYVYKKNGGLSKISFDFNSNVYARYLKEQEKENP